MTGQTTILCPCGGHRVTLFPDKPPVGGKAAFTCPACGERRTFVRTGQGVLFDVPPAQTPLLTPEPPAPLPCPEPGPAAPLDTPAAPAPSAGSERTPRPAPPGATVVLTALPSPPAVPAATALAWAEAVTALFPEPSWHVLSASDPEQARADIRAHAPPVVIAADGPGSRALLAEIAALPGRLRERLTLLVLGDFTDNDALAAFAVSADAVLAGADTEALAARLQSALAKREGLPSLFETD